MMRFIPRPIHGLIDYAYALTAAVLPEQLGFCHIRKANLFCQCLSATVLVNTILTRAEWGVVRVLPFKTHVANDLATGIVAAAAPWLGGFADRKIARNTFIALGVASIAVSLMSRTEEMQ